MELTGKHIVLGVTGGIAAYKSAEVVSRLRHLGACVHVIMTKNATEFVAPLTFQTLSANAVVTDTFSAPEYWIRLEILIFFSTSSPLSFHRGVR